MSYKYFVVTVLILAGLSPRVDATSRDDIERIARASGLALTPQKRILGRIATEGFGIIPAEKRKQELAWEEAQKKEALRKQEEIKRIEAARYAQEQAEFVKQKEEAERREALRHAQELIDLQKKKEEAVRLEAERHSREKDELLKQHSELIQAKEESIKVHEESRRRLEEQHVQEKQALERKLRETQLAEENAQKRAREIKREEVVADDVLLLKAKLAEVEQQRNELLNALTSLKGGQVHLLEGKTSFIPYGGSYIHEEKLKQPNTALDDELKQNLTSIIENVTGLLRDLDSSTSLKAVQKRLTKSQLERLKATAEEFETPVFLRTFNEVQGQLPKLFAEGLVFKEIERMASWLEAERVALSKVGEHRVYVERQLEVSKLVKYKTAEFDSFCEDYLDRVVADMCGWLSPTFTDEEAVKNAKLDFRLRLQTNSIPVLNKYLCSPIAIFGTTDTFLTQTFMKINKGKEYGKFKEVLQSYSTLFHNLGENVKLVEELLNYRFFQRRFEQARENLKEIDLTSIKDLAVRKVVQEMITQDVLSYNETKTTILAASIPSSLKGYMAKRAVTAEESVVGTEVEKLLIAYTQIDAFSANLRAANPRVDEFHE